MQIISLILTRRGMLMVARHIADLIASRRGRASPDDADFDAIAIVFGPKILRPQKFFEIFGPNRAKKQMQSHTPRQADAGQCLWGRV